MSGIGEGLAAVGSMLSVGGNSWLGLPALFGSMAAPEAGAAALPASIPGYAYTAAPTTSMAGPSVAPGAMAGMIENVALTPEMASQMSMSPGPSIAPGMVDASMAGMQVPQSIAGPGMPGIQPPSPFASAMSGSKDVLKTMLTRREPVKIGPPPYMHPGQAVPVKVGQPLARKTSPLERYALFLRRA